MTGVMTESRRVDIAGVTVHPDERWMHQIARNMTMEGYGALRDCRYLLHDRDTKYAQSFRAIIASGGVEPLVLPAGSPNLTCLCGALGQVCERGVLVQSDPLWRALPAASLERICRTFPCRTESSGEGQCAAVPSGYEHPPRRACSMPRATGRTIALLPSRRRHERA